jgi:hypothetical protein
VNRFCDDREIKTHKASYQAVGEMYDTTLAQRMQTAQFAPSEMHQNSECMNCLAFVTIATIARFALQVAPTTNVNLSYKKLVVHL